MIASVKNFALDLLFPSLCIVCEKHLEDSNEKVCAECLSSLSVYEHAVCPVCLNRVAYADKNRPPCHPRAPYLLVAATDYSQPVIKKMVWQLKYENWQSLAEPLGNLMIKCWRNFNGTGNTSSWLIVPLPLHSHRQKRRGFNQAESLAKAVNQEIGSIWLKDNLVRIKDTASQAELADWSARENNVRHAFDINQPELFSGKNIILIDDVFTSGTTLNEAAKVLKSAGAKKIIALVVARAR